jgi:hypothetical protein
VRRDRVAVAACFALNGFVVTSLYARLPAIKADLGLSAGELSLALLGLTAGLLLAQPLTGALVARRGSAPVTVFGAVLCALLVIPPAYAGSLGLLVLACVGLGYANGTLDVAMNVQGVTVERSLGRPILSGLHAAFSVGMLVASALAVVLTQLSALVGVGVLALVVTALFAPHLRGGDAAATGPAFARPTRALAGLGAIAFAALLCEGAVADWSAVHLRETLDATPTVAPLGLAAFSATMIIGRLTADSITVGTRTHVAVGGLLAGVGLVLAALAGGQALSIAGFVVAGLGLSGIFPLMIRSAGDAPRIAAVSTAGYVGLVTGPPLVGAIAEATSLAASLAAVCGTLALVIVTLAWRSGSVAQ